MSIDVKYQLACNFGGFLLQVPTRLGLNQALDAAAGALVASHRRFCAGYHTPDRETLFRQSLALTALNRSLNDPVQAKSSETLCAVMIMSIQQVSVARSRWPA